MAWRKRRSWNLDLLRNAIILKSSLDTNIYFPTIVEICFIFRNYDTMVKPICMSLNHLNFEKRNGIWLRKCLHLRTYQTTSFFYHSTTTPSGPGPSPYRGFTITLRHTTVGRTPLDQWSAHRTDLYLTTVTTDRHPCPLLVSNPQSQQLNGHSPTP